VTRTRIIVTGGHGAIGQWIVRELAKAAPPEVAVYPADQILDMRRLGDVTTLCARATPIDAVILAAATNYRDQTAAPFEHAVSDLEMTTNVLRVLAQRSQQPPPHVVFLSSATVYERANPAQVGRLGETATSRAALPESPIGMTKLVLESLIRMWALQYGGTYTIWRLFNVVTPDEPHDVPGHVQTDLYHRLFVNHDPVIHASTQRRQFTWVGDVAAAIARYLHHERARNKIFNLGSGDARSVRDLVVAMLRAGRERDMLPANYNPQIVDVSDGRERPQDAGIDTTNAQWMLEWSSTTDFQTTIDRFVQCKHDQAIATANYKVSKRVMEAQ
jgi:nucleoside-diphosphate-sugar epimerase